MRRVSFVILRALGGFSFFFSVLKTEFAGDLHIAAGSVPRRETGHVLPWPGSRSTIRGTAWDLRYT